MKVQFKGTEPIQAPRGQVWQFLLDPRQVGHCLPDLQELHVHDQRRFTALVRIGLGPVRGRFKLDVELTPAPDGESAGIALKGAGMGSGLQMSSQVSLEGDSPTVLHWQADAAVSGPLATLGGRLLEGQAGKTIAQLFTAIRQNLEKASA